MQGAHQMHDEWLTMEHGFIDAIYDDQGGPRGATRSFSTSMLMFMARRELTDGAFGVRLMVSADPLMGKSGYPLLFQTGETANGVDPLIDRQHPHDLLMEAALTYSHDFEPRQFRLRVRRTSRGTGAGSQCIHASAVGDGKPGGTTVAPLARFNPHHLGCPHGRLCCGGREARSLGVQWS